MKYQPQVGTYLTDLEQLANFTEAPVLVRNSRVTDLNDCYNDVVYKIISDVDEATQSLDEIIAGLVYDAVVTAVSVISIVFPPVGIALSAALLTQNLVQGGVAYSEGDRAKAMGHFKEALIELASLGKAGIGGAGASQVQKKISLTCWAMREKSKKNCTARPQANQAWRSGRSRRSKRSWPILTAQSAKPPLCNSQGWPLLPDPAQRLKSSV
ncbi:hypothetical protein ACFS4T_05840 [Pseudomonas lini]